MKYYITTLLLLLGVLGNAQITSYEEMGLQLSQDHNQQGTARSMAMKTAFGALGGDLSSSAINPAGGAVAANSKSAFTLGTSTHNIVSTYHNNTVENNTTSFKLNQAGVFFVFKDDIELSNDWKKIVLGVNLQKTNNLKYDWSVEGVGDPTWVQDPVDASVLYTHVDSQKYNNYSSGGINRVNFTAAAQYTNQFYFGLAVNTHIIEQTEESEYNEIAHDGSGNTVDAYQSFWLETEGSGISLSAGVIVKPIQNIRLGLSYTSPTWYEIEEQSNLFLEDESDTEIGYYNLIYSNDPEPYENNDSKIIDYQYNLRTPGKVTGSVAYVFGKKGLISADVSRKDFSCIKLKTAREFEAENTNIATSLKETYQVALGTEWRVKKLSLRAGYSYEQTPYVYAIDTDNISGYAFGLGYNFGSFSLDMAYDYNTHTDYKSFYEGGGVVLSTERELSNSRIVTSLNFVF